MKGEEKSAIFEEFKAHKWDILIATSVIEVGIDVPSATIMAVLGPERFGLSSLHQLRGRVGRGHKPGFFFLVSDKKISSNATARIKILEKTTDGFKISEEDLKIRGRGNLFGTGQSGHLQTRKLACIIQHHRETLFKVKRDVEELMAKDDCSTLHLARQYQEDSTVTKTI